MNPIALQLYLLRDEMTTDVEATLKRVKAMGYDGVEFAGLFGKTYAEIHTLVTEIGLTPVGAHVGFEDLMKGAGEMLDGYALIGCRYVVIPYLPEEYRPGQARFSEFANGATQLGKLCAERKMTLCYHNHDFEFVKVDEKYGLDVLFDAVPADLLQTQIDVGWVAAAGVDPISYLLKYKGRAPTVHMKDWFDAGGGEYGHCPIGGGSMDFAAIIAAAREVGAEWFVVDQDFPATGNTGWQDAETCVRTLKALS